MRTVRPPIGWIGLGNIGRPMAERVLAAGWPMRLWARQRAAAEPLLAQGAEWAPSATQLLPHCDVIVTVVSGPDDVLGLHRELMPLARPDTLFIDCSTAAPRTVAATARALGEQLRPVLDVPVTGGVAGARQGKLTGFVGGTSADLEQARPLLEAFCSQLVPCGPRGHGYRAKLINQTLVAGILMGLADGARLARAAELGLGAAELQAALAGGTANSTLLGAYLPRMLSGEGAVSFTLALMEKDLQLARAEAAELGLAMPLLDATLASLRAAIARLGGAAGVQALAL